MADNETCNEANNETNNETYNFHVKMTCGGCSGAVTRVLGKLEGVESFDVNLEAQKVTVTAKPELDEAVIFEKIKKTGKETTFADKDWNPLPDPVKKTEQEDAAAVAEVAKED